MAATGSKYAVGAALRTARIASGMTIREVAAAAGISSAYLSNVENGNVTPSAKWVHMVLEVIGHQLVTGKSSEARVPA